MLRLMWIARLRSSASSGSAPCPGYARLAARDIQGAKLHRDQAASRA